MTTATAPPPPPPPPPPPGARPAPPVKRNPFAGITTKANRLSPSAMIALGLLGLAVLGWLGILLVGQLKSDPAAPVFMLPGQQAQTAAPVADPINPLLAPNMPPVSGEARRLILAGADGTGLYLPTSINIWRLMSPPYAPPGVDLCSWRLIVDESDVVVPTLEEGQGVPLFEQRTGPCGPPAQGTPGTLPAVVTTTTLGAASGPAR